MFTTCLRVVSWDISVTVVNMLPVGRPGFNASGDFSVRHRFQTDSGARPFSYTMGKGVSFPGGKAVRA